jgi:hypothetical protein
MTKFFESPSLGLAWPLSSYVPIHLSMVFLTVRFSGFFYSPKSDSGEKWFWVLRLFKSYIKVFSARKNKTKSWKK